MMKEIFFPGRISLLTIIIVESRNQKQLKTHYIHALRFICDTTAPRWRAKASDRVAASQARYFSLSLSSGRAVGRLPLLLLESLAVSRANLGWWQWLPLGTAAASL